MRVVLSWSGERSFRVANALHEWLPLVIYAEPWISPLDIEPGKRWADDLVSAFNQAKIGILCLTAENREAPWLHFEAGALLRALDQTRVCTYLYGIQPEDVSLPLSMFQATRCDKAGTKRLTQSINRQMEHFARPEAQLEAVFEGMWPIAEAKFAQVPEPTVVPTNPSERELLQTLLGVISNITTLADPSRSLTA